MASNRTVCTVSVIHSQIRDPEKIIRILAEKLGMKEEDVRKQSRKDFFHREDKVPMWIKVQEMLIRECQAGRGKGG